MKYFSRMFQQGFTAKSWNFLSRTTMSALTFYAQRNPVSKSLIKPSAKYQNYYRLHRTTTQTVALQLYATTNQAALSNVAMSITKRYFTSLLSMRS